MSWNGSRAPVDTPAKKSSQRTQCSQCHCQEFQSDDAVTSAVESDTRTEALILWLSGGASSATNTDGESSTGIFHRCPNRLRASIVILNAIRDACRPHLESSASPATSYSPDCANGKNAEPNFSDKATYEDSFPSLSSMSATAPLTLLVGRKKSKGLKTGNDSITPSSASPSCNKPTSNTGANPESKTRMGIVNVRGEINNHINAVRGENVAPKAKKRIKPVTISISAEYSSQTGKSFTSLSNGAESKWVKGNLSSLPSQDTNEMLGAKALQMPNSGFVNRTKPVSTDAAQKVVNFSTDSTNIDSCNSQMSKRLVMIYSTILRSQLTPSLLIEFHLLVRLLSLSDKSHNLKTTNVNGIEQFCEIFQSSYSCRVFAAEMLSTLEAILINMGHSTLKMFVELPALQRQCPGLCMTLQDVLDAGNSALLFEADQKALGYNTNTPHLTLPFDHARDSRHNYRSVDLNRLFKEREELRDSFLYQLRAFQDVRGRLMEHEQAEKNIGSLKYASKEMLMSVSPGNTLWFVSFFCDLLLQIGLSPISETDSEVLKQIGDKKRLQKLHMRFTSTCGQTDKSSRKLRIDDKKSSTHAKAAPEHNFSGHQEFFAIFLLAGDSYKFNFHLKHRLANILSEMMAVNETKGLCDHIAKTQMLAKFLGMISFSPNYDLADLISDRGEAAYPPINIKECINAAWKQRRLVIVIPWVVQFLGMMKWDEVSRRFQYYIDTFALLWAIKKYCFPYQIHHHSYHQTNMMALSFQLEYLFHDVFGLALSQTLPLLNLPTRKPGDSAESAALTPFDDIPLWFSTPTLFPSIPHLKDLCELLKELAQNDGKMAMITAKKVRPDTVSNFEGSDSRFVSRISYSIDSMSPWSSKRPGASNNKGGIKERLIDSFFHQHKDLQQSCEIVVDCATKNFCQTASHASILPLFRNDATSFEEYFSRSPSMTLEEYTTLLDDLDCKAKEEAIALMSNDLNRVINDALILLAPSGTKPQVIEVAISLAISHATKKGKTTIHSIIREEKKKLLDEFSRKKHKFNAGVPLIAPKRGRAPECNYLQSSNSCLQSLVDLTESLRVLHKLVQSVCICNSMERLKEQKARALDHLQHYVVGAGDSQIVVDFEICILSMLKDFFASPLYYHSLEATIEVSDVLSLLGKLGYSEASTQELESLVCDTSNMLMLIDAVNDGKSSNHISYESIGNFLFMLLDGSLVCYRALEVTLLHAVAVKEEAKYVSDAVLSKLALDRAGMVGGVGMVDATSGLVIMARLQRILSPEQQTKQNARSSC